MKERGVTFEKRTVKDLDEFIGKCDALVNCTGLGSRELIGDHSLVPIRGQIFKVSFNDKRHSAVGSVDSYPLLTFLSSRTFFYLGGFEVY